MASNFIPSLDNKDGHQILHQKHNITNNNMNNSGGDQKAVKSTADTAILHKLSCVEKGYYDDPFIHGMSLGASGLVNNNNNSSRRSSAINSTEPIIRKGTHARVKAVERAIDAFLSLTASSSNNTGSGDKVSSKRQIVILGAGRDTTYLRYRFQHENNNDIINNVNWYEVDHESIIIQKAHTWLPNCIPKDYDCKCYSNEDKHDGTDHQVVSYNVSITPKDTTCEDDKQQQRNSSSSNYHLIGHDLRSSPSKLFDILTSPKHRYDKSIPTLFILECVVMYLPDNSSRDLLRYIANSPKETEASSSDEEKPFVAVVIYDPIPSNDRFGQLMIDNLQKVGIIGRGGRTKGGQQQQRINSNNTEEEDNMPQLSLETTQTLSEQLTKLIECGFDIATGCDMMAAYDHGVISLDDRRRASRCEMLDELEEFVLLMKHYCLLVGVSSCSKEGDDGRTGDDECIGYQLCSVGDVSLIGFREGRSMVEQR